MKKPLLLLFLICIFGCDKDDKNTKPVDQLPPATQTGAGTFGCLINGEAFVVTNTSQQVAIYQGGGLLIGGQKKINNNLRQVNMFISETVIGSLISENNSYILNTDTTPKGEYFNENQNCFYFTSSNYVGTLSITKFDKTNFIISGTFDFKAESNTCQDTVIITEGRFDLKYIP